MASRRALLRSGAVLSAALAGGCRSLGGPPDEIKGGWQMGLQRAGSWTYVTVKPPYIMGPLDSLKLNRGRLSGNMGGRPADIRIEKDQTITGMIGGLPVQLDVQNEGGQLDVWGTWAGATLDLTATDDNIRATVPLSRNGWCCFEYFLRRVPTPEHMEGFTIYVGDRRGLPAWSTQLEIPTVLTGLYTSPELALVVLTLMSSPM